MNVAKFTQDVEIIKKLGTYPNEGEDGLSEDQLKAKFDEAAKYIKEYLNEIIVDALNRTLTAEEILEKIASGGNADVNIGGREFTAGKVIICSDPTREGFYMKSSLEENDNGRPVAEMSGTNEDGTPVIIRNVAPGIIPSDAVNKKQLDDVDRLSRALIVTFENDNYASHNVSDILAEAAKGRDVFLKLSDTNAYIPMVSADEEDYHVQFLRVLNGSAQIYEIRDDSAVERYSIPLDRLDDSKIDAEHTWSSQKTYQEIEQTRDDISNLLSSDISDNSTFSSHDIVKKFAPTIDKKGRLVQCYPFPETEFGVSVLDYVGPATVTVCGKNLFNKNAFTFTKGEYIVAAGGTTGTPNYACVKGFIPVAHLRGLKITLNHPPKEVGGSSPRMVFYTEPSEDSSSVISEGKTNDYTTDVPTTANYMRFTVPIAYADGNDVQIEIGDKVTAFEEYESKQLHLSPPDNDKATFALLSAGNSVHNVFAYGSEVDDTINVSVKGYADPSALINSLEKQIHALTSTQTLEVTNV